MMVSTIRDFLTTFSQRNFLLSKILLLIKELESSALQEIPGGENNQQTDPGALLPAGGTIRVQLYLRICLGHDQYEALVP